MYATLLILVMCIVYNYTSMLYSYDRVYVLLIGILAVCHTANIGNSEKNLWKWGVSNWD